MICRNIAHRVVVLGTADVSRADRAPVELGAKCADCVRVCMCSYMHTLSTLRMHIHLFSDIFVCIIFRKVCEELPLSVKRVLHDEYYTREVVSIHMDGQVVSCIHL